MKLLNASLIAAAIACAAFAPAHAADNMDLDVTITIDKSCDVTSTGDVAFGNALASAGTVDAVGGLVTVQCTIGVPYDVALNAGNNGGSDVGARQMLHTNGTDAIALSSTLRASVSKPRRGSRIRKFCSIRWRKRAATISSATPPRPSGT